MQTVFFPSVEAGKIYEAETGRKLMPLSIICHHATTDGYHVDRCRSIACVLKNIPYEQSDDYDLYIKRDIGFSGYSKLSKIRKFNAQGFAHIVRAVEILLRNGLNRDKYSR